MALRPVGVDVDFGADSSGGFAGAAGRVSNARRASASAAGGGSGGRSAAGFRCLRCATASSSVTRSARRATWAISWPTCALSSRFSLRSVSSSSNEQ